MQQLNASDLEQIFANLTPKQQQTMNLLADGWTSKEIAVQLGISESAVVQRIETVRAKAGGTLRKDLARLYRDFVKDENETCNQNTGKIFHLSSWSSGPDTEVGNSAENDLVLGDAITIERTAPWAENSEPRVVPEVLEGENASLNRLLAAMGLAVGMVVLTLVLLAVAETLGNLV